MDVEVLAAIGALVAAVIGAGTTAILKLWAAVRKTSSEPDQNVLLRRMCEQMTAQTDALRSLSVAQELHSKLTEQRLARIEQDVRTVTERIQN